MDKPTITALAISKEVEYGRHHIYADTIDMEGNEDSYYIGTLFVGDLAHGEEFFIVELDNLDQVLRDLLDCRLDRVLGPRHALSIDDPRPLDELRLRILKMFLFPD